MPFIEAMRRVVLVEQKGRRRQVVCNFVIHVLCRKRRRNATAFAIALRIMISGTMMMIVVMVMMMMTTATAAMWGLMLRVQVMV